MNIQKMNTRQNAPAVEVQCHQIGRLKEKVFTVIAQRLTVISNLFQKLKPPNDFGRFILKCSVVSC